jgi:hypothetical protein
MASKIKIKILTALMIMTCTETHGKSEDNDQYVPNWYPDPINASQLFISVMRLLGIDYSSWNNTTLNSGAVGVAQVPTLGSGIQKPVSVAQLLGLSSAPEATSLLYAINGNGLNTIDPITGKATVQHNPGIQTLLGAVPTEIGPNITESLDTMNKGTALIKTTVGSPKSGSTPASGLVLAVDNINAGLNNTSSGLIATNSVVKNINANIGTPVALFDSASGVPAPATLFANQVGIASSTGEANATLTNGTSSLSAIKNAVNTTNNNIGTAVAVSGSKGPTLFQNQAGIVGDITNAITTGNDEITNSIALAQKAITGLSAATGGYSVAGATAETANNIRVAQNTVTGAETGTALGSLGATGQSIAMSTAATGGNITAGTAATALDVQAAQNTVTGSPSGTPLGSLSDGGQSTVDSEMTTQGNITAAQNTVTGSEMKTPLGYISQTGQSIAGSTIATKINITDAQNTVTGSPSTTPLGYLAPGGQSIAGSTAATAGNTESALMLVQNAITGAEIGTSLGSLGTTGQNIAESTTLTADTVTTAQNTLQGNNPLATLSGIVTSIGDPTVATTPGTSGATIQGTQTAMASDAAVALTKVDASLAKIEKTTEKTANTALQRADSGVTLSDTVTFAANPTLAMVSGAMGATVGEIPTAMASDAAISSRRVDASSIQIPGITDKTAKNIATTKATKNGVNPKKGGSSSGNAKMTVRKGTLVARSKNSSKRK